MNDNRGCCKIFQHCTWKQNLHCFFVNKHVFNVVHCLQLLKYLLHPEYVHLTKRRQYIFCVSLKFGAYHITGQWGEVIKMLLNAFFIFHYKICVFIIFISFFLSFFLFFFWWSIKFSQQNINQSETRIGSFQLSVELHTRLFYKSIYNFLLLNQFSCPSVMLRHILNYQHMHVRLVRTHKVF